MTVLEKQPRICDVGGPRGVVFPTRPLNDTDPRFKVLIYGFLLLYSFIGVSIVADMFMAAIERITSKKRRIQVPGTRNRYITTNVWNETVANLTLMALGSSAPEILLAVNEILKNEFHSGELGPSTIVGSAAFNLFVIIAVCINAVPPGETRQIKETGVFAITAVFSVFAYVWMLFIVQFNSPDIITVTEGALTFLCMPAMVYVSYASDAGLYDDFFNRMFGRGGESKQIEKGGGGVNGMHALGGGQRFGRTGIGRDEGDPTEETNFDVEVPWCITCWAGLCAKLLAIFKKLCSKPAKCCRWISRTLRLTKAIEYKKEDAETEDDEEIDEGMAEIDLEDSEIQILDENGDPIENEAGVITFKSDTMEVMGDLDDQQYMVPVLRKNGVEGRVSCKYRMEKFNATPGYDYVEEEGTVDFKNGVAKAEIEITILPKEIGERVDQFQIILEDPAGDAIFNPNSDGGDDQCLLTITILNANPACDKMSRVFGILDGWVNMDEMRQGSAAWYDQIAEAYYCNGSAEDQEEAKFLDWVMHVTFFPWKMVYAVLTPPPPYIGGWVCFCVALMHIGILTAIIGDMAELFGCAAGIENNITAISVVALGTSLPDLFASKTAATQDEWADASIVNVTGSNSVNVFLGIGLPWMTAAIYWNVVDGSQDALWMEKYGDTMLGRCPTGCFVVESGDLGFSVIVFTIGALITLVVIRIRRVLYDGELGGPAGSDSKACSSFLLVLLWFFYISLSVWKSVAKVEEWKDQIIALVICIPVITGLMILFGLMLQLLRLSKDYIGDEGFFGIAITSTILIIRAVYFLVFQ